MYKIHIFISRSIYPSIYISVCLYTDIKHTFIVTKYFPCIGSAARAAACSLAARRISLTENANSRAGWAKMTPTRTFR